MFIYIFYHKSKIYLLQVHLVLGKKKKKGQYGSLIMTLITRVAAAAKVQWTLLQQSLVNIKLEYQGVLYSWVNLPERVTWFFLENKCLLLAGVEAQNSRPDFSPLIHFIFWKNLTVSNIHYFTGGIRKLTWKAINVKVVAVGCTRIAFWKSERNLHLFTKPSS